MAPRDLDDEDALTTGAAQTDPAGTSLADDAFRWATAEEGRYSGGVDETDDARLHTHATVDNTVQEVDVVLVGDADDVAAALKALDTALEEGEAAAADDPAAVLRAAFNDRAVRRSPDGGPVELARRSAGPAHRQVEVKGAVVERPPALRLGQLCPRQRPVLRGHLDRRSTLGSVLTGGHSSGWISSRIRISTAGRHRVCQSALSCGADLGR